jgi:CRP-like cAMP-binding protein
MQALEQSSEENWLLKSVDPDDYEWISEHLKPVELKVGDVFAERDQPFEYVYFMGTGVVSVTNQVADGTVEVGTVGNEGVAGLAAWLSGSGIPSRTFVQVPGAGKRMKASVFAEGVDERPALRRLVNRYIQGYMVQVAQTAACNRAHNVSSRCARWLLMTHDRVNGSDTFPLTHQFLAYMLGVRRAGVTVAAGELQKAGLIKYTRGHVTILDRAGLEQAACECYETVRNHMRNMVGKSAG